MNAASHAALRCLLAALSWTSIAAPAAPELPPAEVVKQGLRSAPLVQAADHQIRAEEANRTRLEAGSHEWTLKVGGQRRKTNPAVGPQENFREWDASIERSLRLPGKGALDAKLGAKGVDIARTARGDALHESGRAFLKYWFTWLKEQESAAQWREQSALLARQAKAVERRRQLGDAARLESIQSEAAQAQADAQWQQAKAREQSAAEDLQRRYPAIPLPARVELSEPQALEGDPAVWVAAILEHNHELGLARGEAQRAQLQAARSGRERLPDPTIGIQTSRERNGEERVIGAYLSISLPGQGRFAATDAARAQADAASSREAAALQKVTAEAASLVHAVTAARAVWAASRDAAARLAQAAAMTERAYQLGEGSLNDLLASRRLANEAQLAARLLQLDALESRYRLLLDAHQLWDFDED